MFFLQNNRENISLSCMVASNFTYVSVFFVPTSFIAYFTCHNRKNYKLNVKDREGYRKFNEVSFLSVSRHTGPAIERLIKLLFHNLCYPTGQAGLVITKPTTQEEKNRDSQSANSNSNKEREDTSIILTQQTERRETQTKAKHN